MSGKRKSYIRKNGFNIFSAVFSLLIVALCAIPLIWMFVSSLSWTARYGPIPSRSSPRNGLPITS